MKIIANVFFLVIGFVLGYLIFNTTSSYKEPPDGVNKQAIPECYSGLCPEYESWDTNGDGLSESVVLVPTTMTKGAGEIWIIENGSVVFKSRGGAYVSYEVPESGGGINISYAGEFDDTGLEVKNWVTEKWKYRDGLYLQE